MNAEAIVAGLDPDQYRAVTERAHTVRVLAGAGSGKTRVLTRRIAYRAATEDLEPGHALVLTFTRKAAFELRRRLGMLGLRDQPIAGTFHGIAYAQLRTRWADHTSTEPSFVDNRYGHIRRMLGDHSLARQAGALTTEIDWARARRVRPEGYVAATAAANRRPPIATDIVADVFERYEQEKRTRRRIDFDDVLEQCINALNRDREFADAQRWRFRHLFVDEFQDVNPLQFALLRAWLGPRDDLCVVGDPNQSIYGWNGAERDLLEDLGSHLKLPVVTINLRRNHRSTPEIAGLAVSALAPSARENARMISESASGPLTQIRGAMTDVEEMAALVDSLRHHHVPGSSWSRQAVLVRTNELANVARAALENVNIPCRIRGADRLTNDPEIKRALGELEASPDLAIGAADLQMDAPLGPEGEAMRNVARLVRTYRELEQAGTVKGFVRWLQASGRSDDSLGGDGVDIVTFHSAKGLEWPVVHICGVEAGYVPISYARTRKEQDEERRMLYVALTRAKEAVLISWARSRNFKGTMVEREPSPYLADILTANAELALAQSPGRDAADAIAEIRRTVGLGAGGLGAGGLVAEKDYGATVSRLPDPAERAREALASWRATAAKAAKVAPHAVVRDDVLEQLATIRPTDIEALSEIPGFGPFKASRYGDQLLELLR